MSLAPLLSIVTGSADPIYRQIVEQLRRLISSGQMRAGDELPSVRDLAQALAVNPMTVSRAYGLLEQEGLAERRRGLPMLVAARHVAAQPLRDRTEQLRPTLQRAAREAHELEVTAAQALSMFESLLIAPKEPIP